LQAFSPCQRSTFGGNNIFVFFGVILFMKLDIAIPSPDKTCNAVLIFLPGSLGLPPGTRPTK
jgi:hypothetical protein